MARKLIQYIEITDDFDRESPADETVEVALDGMVYEIDMSSTKAKALRKFLAPYQEVAHDKWKMPARPGQKKKRVTAQALPAPTGEYPVGEYGDKMRDRDARNDIRDWATATGMVTKTGKPIGRQGKIPTEILQAYMDANPGAYVPETTLRDAGMENLASVV